MADQVTKYKIEYVVVDKASTVLDKIERRLNAFDARLQKSINLLKSLGQDTSGLTKLTSSLQAVDARLKTTNGVAKMAATSLKSVGNGNSSVTSLTRRLEAMIAQLHKVPAASASAKQSLNGIGTGASISLNQATSSADKFGGSLLAFSAGRLVVNQVTKALDEMGESFVKAREHQTEGAESGLDKRGRAREYANLLGKDGPDDVTMHRAFKVALAGGYSFTDAITYGEQFLGSSPAGVQASHVTPEQLEKLELEGAKFANRIGLDPATGGDLAGLIPQFTNLTKDEQGNPLTTDQGLKKAMGQLGALQYGLNEGRGKISTLARSEIGAMIPAMANGRIIDHAEGGAFVGVASTFSKTGSSAGTAFKQFDSLINNADGEEGSDQKGDYLKRIGVAGAKGDLAKLGALKADIDTQRQANPQLDLATYLTSKGFHSREERNSTIGFLSNYDILVKRTEEARKRADSGGDVIDANRRYASSLEGQNQQAETVMEYGNYVQTERYQRLAVARKAALGQLQAENKIDTSDSNFKDWFMDYASGPTRQWSGDLNTRAVGIDTRVRENLVAAGREVGIDLEKAYPGFVHGNGEGTTWTMDQVTNDIGRLAEQRGVSISGRSQGGNSLAEAQRQVAESASGANAVGAGGAAPVVGAVDAVGRKIDQQTERLVNAIQGGRGGNGGPPPVVVNPGNGGAGSNPRRP